MKRTYPQWELAAHVLGFVGVENEGLGGVEYLYDGVMRGETTRVNLKVDGRRHVYNRESSGTGSGGNIVVLNLDESIQYSVEQILGDTVREFKAASGSAIVMDVHTGEILALASHPTYNPNDYTNYGPEEKRNRAILDIYEPGSTFKLVTLSAALEEGLVQSGELVDCGSERCAWAQGLPGSQKELWDPQLRGDSGQVEQRRHHQDGTPIG